MPQGVSTTLYSPYSPKVGGWFLIGGGLTLRRNVSIDERESYALSVRGLNVIVERSLGPDPSDMLHVD